MNKFNVYITAIVVAGFVLVSAIWGAVTILTSRDVGLFDYLGHMIHVTR